MEQRFFLLHSLHPMIIPHFLPALYMRAFPLFLGSAQGSFRNYVILFWDTTTSPPLTSANADVTVNATSKEVIMKSNVWKRVLSIPGAQGGPAYWAVGGAYKGGGTSTSVAQSITIESPQSVKNAKIAPTNIGSLPILSWENNCNVKFKVWFGNDAQFLQRPYTFSPPAIKNPLNNDGEFSQALTSQQWDSITKLVGGQTGETIYWKVESWDGANRSQTTPSMSFILEE